MNTKIQSIKNFIKNHKIIGTVSFLVLVFILFKVFGGANSNSEYFAVKKGDIVQKVIVNGKTKAVRDSNLAFEVNGTISKTFVDVGSRVSVGQSLLSLDSGSAYAEVLKAKANLESEKARLDELKRGTRPEEIAVSEIEVKNAEVKYSDAQKNLYNKVVDIVTNTIDQFFSNPRTNNPQFNLISNDIQLKNNINLGRLKVETIITNWNNNEIENYLSEINSLIDNVAMVVNSQTQSSGLSQTTIDSYKSSVSTARSAFVTARETLNTAKSTLLLAQQNLSLKKSGSTPEAIRAQEAKVLQNEAALTSAEVNLAKMTLRSPQNGIVTKLDAKVGEAVTSGKVIVSVISDNDLEIESNVSEVSIGRVNVGNNVLITFDAFPGENFKGTVTYIEPGETIVDGVVNYKVTVAFSEEYKQIKSGLTSRLEIITGEKKDVLVIPEYAITKEGEISYVKKIVGKDIVKVEVKTGLRGQDGLVEVVEGLVLDENIEIVANN